MEHVIIDLREKAQAPTEEEADLIIEIDLFPSGYDVVYHVRKDGVYEAYNIFTRLMREEMVKKHVQVIRDTRPRTAAVRTGRNSTGHVKDIALHPGVIKSIIEGKLGVENLTFHS